jgi:hypothetical protein
MRVRGITHSPSLSSVGREGADPERNRGSSLLRDSIPAVLGRQLLGKDSDVAQAISALVSSGRSSMWLSGKPVEIQSPYTLGSLPIACLRNVARLS